MQANRSSQIGGSRRGFTLIELLVVIAIIALLVSILMPSLKKAKDLAQRSACGIHLRNIHSAAMAYATDHEGRLMYCGGWYRWYGNYLHYTMLHRMYDTGYKASRKEAINLGQLIEAGILGSWSNQAPFNCPTVNYQGGEADEPHTSNSSYLRHPLPGESRWQGPELDDLRPDMALYADRFQFASWVREMHKDGINVLYVGGAVQYWQDRTPPLITVDRGVDQMHDWDRMIEIWDYVGLPGHEPPLHR
ncbi:MAG: type II secretion system protein [Planctomycetota bacterium]